MQLEDVSFEGLEGFFLLFGHYVVVESFVKLVDDFGRDYGNWVPFPDSVELKSSYDGLSGVWPCGDDVGVWVVSAVVWFVFGEGVFDWVSLGFSGDYVDERRGGPGHVWFFSVVLMRLL